MRWGLDWSCVWLAGCDGLEEAPEDPRSEPGSAQRTASRPAATASGPGWRSAARGGTASVHGRTGRSLGSGGEWTEARRAWCWGCAASSEATGVSSGWPGLVAASVAANPSTPPGGSRLPGGAPWLDQDHIPCIPTFVRWSKID